MSQRQEKLNSLFQETISAIIRQHIDVPDNILVTVAKVNTSPDMKNVIVYITTLPDNKRGTALKVLRKAKPIIQQELGKNIETRVTPRLKFEIDAGEVYATEMDKLFDEIKEK